MKQDDNEDLLQYFKDSLEQVELYAFEAGEVGDHGAAIYGVQVAIELRQKIHLFSGAIAAVEKIESVLAAGPGMAPMGTNGGLS